MSTQFTNRQWRLPNNENKDKLSNYSMDKFDQNDYISTPLTIDEFGSATMSIWFKTSLSQSDRYFLTFPEASGANGFDLNFVTSGIKSYLVGHSGSSNITSTFTYNDGNWHHVIVSYSGTNHKMYIDGVLTASSSATVGTIKNAEGNLYIGALSSLHPTFRVYQTNLDQVAVFNYALSDGGVSVGQTATGQIATLYGGGSAIGNPMSLSPAPIAYYPLGDQDAFNGADYLVPNIAAQEADGDIATSYSPYALDFDGTDDYIDVPADSSLVLGSGDFTISFWIKTSDSTANILNPISSTGAGFFGLMIYQSKLRWNDQYNVSNLWVINNTQIVTNAWINVVVVRNSSTFSVFYNNVSQTLTATSDSQNYSGNNGYRIGSGNLGELNGSLSNISIWNAALTSSQVSEIYSEGIPQNLNNHSAYSNLVSWWQLGSNSSFNTNWTVLDEKGSNNGTSVNMIESDIVDGVGSYANGLSSGMGGDEVIGDAPYSSSNSLSVNMDVEDRTTDTPS